MKHAFTSVTFLTYARRGALLLALGTAGPAAWGQSFGPVSFYSAGANSSGSGGALSGVALGDVTGDGRLDVVASNYAGNGVAVLPGLAGGSFASPGFEYSTGSGSVPNGIALADVNGDGRLDAVAANQRTYSAGVLLGQATGGFAPVSIYSAGSNKMPGAVALGDVNGDGRPDIVTTNSYNNEMGVLLAQASGGFAPVSAYATGAGGSAGVALGDVNGDGQLDIVTAKTNAAGVLLGQAGGTFALITTYSFGPGANSSPNDVALGDLNSDGRLDIVFVDPNNASTSVLLGQASGGFGFASTYSTNGNTPIGVALGDVTGDGRLDIVTANGAGSVSVLPGLAGGTFAAAVVFAIGPNTTPSDVALGDLNGDGRLDIVTSLFANSTNNVGVLLNTGTYLATARPTPADLTLAPNPAHEAFTVRLPAGLAPTQAELLNALGQVVRRPAVGAASFTVATSGLATGIYTLRLRAGGAALARRVVVE
ncbi:hypothetical protein ACVWYF_001413 [Hymenobacter sp. UYAg731]